MKTIEKQIAEVLKNQPKEAIESPKRESYEKALNKFNVLIDRGLTTKRGYNLSSVSALSFDNQK